MFSLCGQRGRVAFNVIPSGNVKATNLIQQNKSAVNMPEKQAKKEMYHFTHSGGQVEKKRCTSRVTYSGESVYMEPDATTQPGTA